MKDSLDFNIDKITEDIDYASIYDSFTLENKPELGPIFISKDGKFINLGYNNEHSIIFGGEDYESDDYYVLEDLYELIKANSGSKWETFPYIDIWTIPNSSQKYAIIDWLYFIKEKGVKKIWVNTSDTNEAYDLTTELPEDIYKTIIRTISMSNQRNLEEKLDKHTLITFDIPKNLNADSKKKCMEIHLKLASAVREFNNIVTELDKYKRPDNYYLPINKGGHYEELTGVEKELVDRWNQLKETIKSLENDFETAKKDKKTFDGDSITITTDDVSYLLTDVIDKLSNDELLNKCGINIVEALKSCSGATFILPSGKIISTEQNGCRTHLDFVVDLFEKIVRNYFSNKEVTFSLSYYIEDYILNWFVNNRNWLKCNDGKSQWESRFYCVIPKNKLTQAQYDALEEFLQYGETITSDVIVLTYDSTSQVYNFKETFSEDIIKKIKRYYLFGSLTENVNKDLTETLTPQQEEFFKDSKIRDSQGNLLVCYHGARTPGFKEFKPNTATSQFGKYKFGDANVNYFTTSKQAAISFTEIGVEEQNNVYACYLNVVNPFVVNNKSIADIKSSFNIRDDRIREKQLKLFNSFWNNYSGKYVDETDLVDINRKLRVLNYELRPSSERTVSVPYTKEEDYYDLYYLGSNSFFGNERPVMYAYALDEFFDNDMYEEVRDEIVGDVEEDYYLSTDDIVRYVLAMNEEDGTNYDGIVISDIIDSKEMFGLPGTDIITLKSSNQIKLINNENPTSSNNIDEAVEDAINIEKDSVGNQLSTEQIAFFKDSKARDSKGNLLVCYHGSKTKDDFDTFVYNKDKQTGTDFGKAFYFTTDLVKAQGYSVDIFNDSRINRYKAEKDALLKKFLQTKSEKDKDAYLKYKLDGKYELEDLLNDEDYSQHQERLGHTKSVYLNITNPLIVDANGKYFYEVYPDYFEIAKKKGNDGIIVHNVVDIPRGIHRPIDTYICFNENQIKSINNKTPTSSDNINEELITGQTGIFDVDVFVTDNAYSAKTKLYSLDVLSRIFIDDNLYLIADAWDITHTGMVSVAQQNGYNTKFNDLKQSQICLICAPIESLLHNDYDEITDIIDDDYDTAYDYENFIIYSRYNDFKKFDLYKVLGKPLRIRTLKKSTIREAIKISHIEPGTCGYILENGDLIQLDEYHVEESEYKGKRYPEYSNTHHEEDTCIRVFKEPTQEQYNRIEEIADLYISKEEYCKLEIEDDYYKIFSLFQGACEYPYGDEKVGNWTGYDLVREIKNYYNIKNNKNKEPLTESIVLDEATRNQLITKSRNADDYAKNNRSKGRNRYERRLRSTISSNKATYNRIDMDSLFKRDILTVGIEVHGETDDYIVTVKFNGVLKELANLVKQNKGKLEYKVISQALARAFNSDDLKVHCSCPDSKYRQSYYQWKNNYGTQVEPRPSKITNPNDTKGAGCKHTLLVLSNLDWALKVASVLNNYIKYCQKNLQVNYATYIFPKIYGMPYNRAVQLNMFDTGLLPSDQKTIEIVATQQDKNRDEKGRWVSGNDFRYVPKKPAVSKNQLTFDLDSNEKEIVPEDEED